MMTKGQLRFSFKVYAEEVGRCKKSGCYWSLLHLVLVLPEVCSALETEAPEDREKRTEELYKEWCRKYVASEDFNESEWWAARRNVFHEKLTPARYSGFIFSPPGGPGHKLVDPDSKKLRLDVWSLADQVLAGIERWFDALLEDSRTLACVERKIPELVWVDLSPPPPDRPNVTSPN